MDPLEKEARIRLYMEKIRKEEEETKKIRLSEEKKLLEDKAQKELEDEIFKSSKNRVVLDKIKEYLKTNDWVKIIEQMNECLFECGYKRMLETRNDYNKINKNVGEMIINELQNPYERNFLKEFIYKINCNEYGIGGGVVESEKHSLDCNKNHLSILKSFNEVISQFASFERQRFFYYEAFSFVRKHIIGVLKKYDSDGYYSF